MKREVIIGDIVEFVEVKVRIVNYLVFGNIYLNDDKNIVVGIGFKRRYRILLKEYKGFVFMI